MLATLSDHEQRFSRKLHRRFKKLKVFVGKDPPMSQRIKQKMHWDRELKSLVDNYIDNPEARVKAQYLMNGPSS